MKLTIRWSLIIGFLCLIWGTYVVTTTSTFVSSQKTLNGHAMNIMENIADLAMEKSQNHLAHAHGAAVLTRRLLAANVVSVNESNIDSLNNIFWINWSSIRISPVFISANPMVIFFM